MESYRTKEGIEWLAFVAARVVVAGLLVWALARHPIGYFTMLRFVVCGVCLHGAFYAGRLKQIGWMWLMIAVAVLFNPLIPIYLKKERWQILDVAAAIFLLVSILLLQPSRKSTGE